MLGLELQPLPFNTICDEYWFKSIFELYPEEAATDPENYKYWFMDMRSGAPDIWTTWEDKALCSKNPELMAKVVLMDYMYDQHMMQLCPDWLKRWVKPLLLNEKLVTDADKDWYVNPNSGQAKVPLDSFKKYFVTSLIHEFMHINPMSYPGEPNDEAKIC